jgi:hypothetical protein
MRAVARIVGVVCLMWACLCAPARVTGAPPHSDALQVAVLPVRVDAQLEEHWLVMLEARLVEGLRRGQFELIGSDRVLEAAPEAAKCEAPGCLVAIAHDVGADALLRWRIEGEERHYTVELELVGKDGLVVISSRESCEVCGIAEVGDVLAHQAAALRGKLDAGALAAPVLRFTSSPPGATIAIDGQTVGATPLERVVDPGAHQTIASLPGYVGEARRVVAVTGVQETVHFSLSPVAGDEPREARRWAPWGWAAFGTGLAVAGGGVALLVLDSRPYPGRCTGADVDLSGHCKYLYDTFAGGVAATVTGALLTVGGIAILLATRRKRDRRARTSMHRTGFDLEVRF